MAQRYNSDYRHTLDPRRVRRAPGLTAGSHWGLTDGKLCLAYPAAAQSHTGRHSYEQAGRGLPYTGPVAKGNPTSARNLKIDQASLGPATAGRTRECTTHTSFIENSIEAGNLLRGNDALHAMLGDRTRARMQSALVTMMFTCLIARLLN